MEPESDHDHHIPFVAFDVGQIAPLFPGLHIEKLIATGGMGGVYLARQINLDRRVALKILPPAGGSESGTAERFAHEARLMAQLSHPNIVSLYDFGQSGGLYYFIMEYVHGATFHELIQSRRIDSSNATQLMITICAGVSFAHKRGVLHHDLKPGNLMLNDEHKAKLLDFGLAGIFKPGHRDTAAASWGTADYAAPERSIHDAPIDHRADIYSLGVIYYEALTGEVPRQGYTLPSKSTGLNPKVDEIIQKCLAQNPDDRYPNVDALEADLKKLLKMPRIKTKSARPLAPATPPPQGKPARQPGAVSSKRPAPSATAKPSLGKTTVSAKSAPKKPVAARHAAAAAPTSPSAASQKRRPQETVATSALASQKQAQSEWEIRMKAEKKRQEIKIALILTISGAIAIGLLVFFLAN